jgi:HEPN domain-containing protein
MQKTVEAWVEFADTDLLAVSEILERPELTNIVAFHCQQAIEKYFKALILETGKPLPKIHNLLTLYGTVKEIMDLGLDENLLATVNDVYLDSRYPGEVGLLDGVKPTVELVGSIFSFAKEVATKIKGGLNKTQI